MSSVKSVKARLEIGKSLQTGDIVKIKGHDLEHAGNLRVVKTKTIARELANKEIQEDVEVFIDKTWKGQMLHSNYIFALEVDIAIVMKASTVAQQQKLRVE